MARKRILRRDDFRDRISTAYHDAIRWHQTHDAFSEAQHAAVNHPDYSRLTREDKGYLSGYREACYRHLWDNVVWRLGPASGPMPEGFDGWEKNGVPGPFSALAREPGAMFGGHFWKGTDKPFTSYASLDQVHVRRAAINAGADVDATDALTEGKV